MKRKAIGQYVCSFCGKDQSQVLRLIAGPKSVFICNECVAAQRKEPHEGQFSNRSIGCSFCGKKLAQVSYLAAGSRNVYICDECLDLCAEIIEEEGRLT